MPFCEIPSESLANLSLFGYKIEAEQGEMLIISNPSGRREMILKHKPILWFDNEDMSDAIQLKAIAVFSG